MLSLRKSAHPERRVFSAFLALFLGAFTHTGFLHFAATEFTRYLEVVFVLHRHIRCSSPPPPAFSAATQARNPSGHITRVLDFRRSSSVFGTHPADFFDGVAIPGFQAGLIQVQRLDLEVLGVYDVVDLLYPPLTFSNLFACGVRLQRHSTPKYSAQRS